MKFIIILFSVIALECCKGSNLQFMIQQDSEMSIKELKGSYTITSLGNDNVSVYNLKITFNDSTKQVSGFSGCNRFFSSYNLENSTLKFGEMASTKMLCKDISNKIEQQLLKALNEANIVLFNEEGFTLFNGIKQLISASKEKSYDDLKFEYTAQSRGVYKQILLNKKTISSVNRRGETPINKVCSDNHWKQVTKILEGIDIKSISKFEAPSKAFQYDGAAIAHFKIIDGDKTYETLPFDHGNPPKEISELVKEILSISENIE